MTVMVRPANTPQTTNFPGNNRHTDTAGPATIPPTAFDHPYPVLTADVVLTAAIPATADHQRTRQPSAEETRSPSGNLQRNSVDPGISRGADRRRDSSGIRQEPREILEPDVCLRLTGEHVELLNELDRLFNVGPQKEDNERTRIPQRYKP